MLCKMSWERSFQKQDASSPDLSRIPRENSDDARNKVVERQVKAEEKELYTSPTQRSEPTSIQDRQIIFLVKNPLHKSSQHQSPPAIPPSKFKKENAIYIYSNRPTLLCTRTPYSRDSHTCWTSGRYRWHGSLGMISWPRRRHRLAKGWSYIGQTPCAGTSRPLRAIRIWHPAQYLPDLPDVPWCTLLIG